MLFCVVLCCVVFAYVSPPCTETPLSPHQTPPPTHLPLLVCTCRYRSPKDPKYVEYKALSDEMESMFAIQGLEKMPTLHPELMAPPDSYEARTQLTPEQQQILERTMHRLAERVW